MLTCRFQLPRALHEGQGKRLQKQGTPSAGRARDSASNVVCTHQRVLIDHIHKAKAEQSRTKVLADQMEARRTKNKAARERRAGRVAEKRSALTAIEAEDAKE